MKTLTVRLPEALVAQIEAESRRRKLSKSELGEAGRRVARLSRASTLTRPRGATPLGALVVSRGDSAVDLQVTDHALDAVALAIHAPVPADFGLAIGFGRNAGTDAGLMQAGADDW